MAHHLQQKADGLFAHVLLLVTAVGQVDGSWEQQQESQTE